MPKEYISREAAINAIEGINWYKCNDEGRIVQGGTIHDKMFLPYKAVEGTLKSLPAADVREIPEGGIGEMSDGYHTFNGLYYQRMILFAALVKQNRERAWKSLRHEDGELCFGGGWFIVGIDTPKGNYTYHYEDKYWNWFECEELPVAKHWDGHTEKDVTRLLSLPDVRENKVGRWLDDWETGCSTCPECGESFLWEDHKGVADWHFCPNCGASMKGN